MLKGFKTEINPTQEQREKINRTIGTCRYVYNLFLGYNKERHLRGQEYLNAYAFSKWLNNEYVPENPDKSWIKEVSAKAVKRAIMNADTACKRFFKKKGGYPRFKRKDKSDVKMYFVRNNDTDCLCERHRIKIPTLGWVRLKEKGYLPVTKTGLVIKSGTISERAGRYWVSVLADVPVKIIRPRARNDDGLGIDLGIKDLAILSNGKVFKNINRTGRERQLEKSLKRKQRSLSRKHENKKKGGAAQGKNIQKQILRIQRLHRRISVTTISGRQ